MSDFHQPLSGRNVSNMVNVDDMFYIASGLLEPASRSMGCPMGTKYGPSRLNTRGHLTSQCYDDVDGATEYNRWDGGTTVEQSP